MRALNNKGFLLIDIMVAIMITVVALMAVGGLVVMTTSAFKMNAVRTDAFKLAQAQMEAYKNVTSAEWKALPITAAYATITPPRAITFSDARFTLFTQARREAAVHGVTDRLVQVKVVVRWAEPTRTNSSQTSQVELYSLFQRDP